MLPGLPSGNRVVRQNTNIDYHLRSNEYPDHAFRVPLEGTVYLYLQTGSYVVREVLELDCSASLFLSSFLPDFPGIFCNAY